MLNSAGPPKAEGEQASGLHTRSTGRMSGLLRLAEVEPEEGTRGDGMHTVSGNRI